MRGSRSPRFGLGTAGLFLATLLATAATASADPIGRPWSGSGTVLFDSGLSGSSCSLTVAGATDGTAITSAAFPSCAGFVTALPPWTVSWNGTGTGGTIAMAALHVFIVSCLYTGALSFTYASRTMTIAESPMTLLSGAQFCPPRLLVRGTIAVA